MDHEDSVGTLSRLVLPVARVTTGQLRPKALEVLEAAARAQTELILHTLDNGTGVEGYWLMVQGSIYYGINSSYTG